MKQLPAAPPAQESSTHHFLLDRPGEQAEARRAPLPDTGACVEELKKSKELWQSIAIQAAQKIIASSKQPSKGIVRGFTHGTEFVRCCL